MSLHPSEASLLRIHRGRVWVTLGVSGAPSPQSSSTAPQGVRSSGAVGRRTHTQQDRTWLSLHSGGS